VISIENPGRIVPDVAPNAGKADVSRIGFGATPAPRGSVDLSLRGEVPSNSVSSPSLQIT
jgi:hypothetical protein